MPAVLVLFLDGVGLGQDDRSCNPLAAARTPFLETVLGGRKLLAGAAPFHGELATLVAIDACLGVAGMPQSASGQAALLTGRNVPAEIGEHYGPKPNPAIAEIVRTRNLFMETVQRGGSAALLNAYPPAYYQAIDSRRRLYSAIPMAARAAGLALMTAEDLQAGRALSPDFTGAGWRAQPGFPPAPLLTPRQAGLRLASLASAYSLAWFDHWPSDYAGHRASMPQAVELVETLDGVLAALMESWAERRGLIVVTSDHGNLEDLRGRRHTRNPVPGLLLGPQDLRHSFSDGLVDLTGFHDAILRTLDLGA